MYQIRTWNERPKIRKFRTAVDTLTLPLNCLNRRKTPTVVTEKEDGHGGYTKQVRLKVHIYTTIKNSVCPTGRAPPNLLATKRVTDKIT